MAVCLEKWTRRSRGDGRIGLSLVWTAEVDFTGYAWIDAGVPSSKLRVGPARLAKMPQTRHAAMETCMAGLCIT